MKKILAGLLLALFLAGTVQAYTVQRGDTVSQIARDHNTTVENIVVQNSLEDADLIYEGQELSLEDETFGVSVPTVIALYEDSLASRITSAATSMTLVRGTDKQSRSLSGFYGFVVDEGSSTEEFMTANCTATACTITARGIDVQDGETEVSALKFEHRRGASVKISNFPQLALLSRIITGQETTGTNTLMIGDTSATTTKNLIFTHGTSTAFRGIGWNGTNLIWSDDGSSTYTFSSSSPSVLSASTTRAIGVTDSKIYLNASSTTGMAFDSTSGALYQKTSSTKGISSDSNGLYIDGSDAISWSGAQTFSGGITNTGTSTLATTTATNLAVNGTNLSTLLNGSNAETLHYHDTLLFATTTNKSESGTSETSVFSTTIPANTLGTGNAIRVKMPVTAAGDTVGEGTMTMKIKYGSVTSSMATTIHRNLNGNGYYEAYIIAAGATNAQEIVQDAFIATTFGGQSTTAGFYVYKAHAETAAAVDSTVAQTLEFTITISNGGASFSSESILVEVIH